MIYFRSYQLNENTTTIVISSKGGNYGCLIPIYFNLSMKQNGGSKVENGNGMGAQRGYYLTSGGLF